MKFISGESTVFVKLKNVTSVSVMCGTDYESKEKEFYVEISSISGMIVRVLATKNETDAKSIQHQIGEKLDSENEEKTYLDGFKEGTEYALNLIALKKEKEYV